VLRNNDTDQYWQAAHSTIPRIAHPSRELKGIHFAMAFKTTNKRVKSDTRFCGRYYGYRRGL